MIQILVQIEDFDPGVEIARLHAVSTEIGAVASFVGLVRGAGIEAMTLEHYPAMTERALTRIAEQAAERWPLDGVTIIHRVGRLLPGDRIVFAGAASRHRAAAFDACAFLMDYLKTRAPFWKREEAAGVGRWVEAQDGDVAAAGRWGG